MAQAITIQVGQSGNQIGARFWDLALQEHASFNKDGVFDLPLSSFFRNCDDNGENLAPWGSDASARKMPKIRHLRARAVLVDMEEGVLNSIRNHSRIQELFDRSSFVSSQSGSGNNWSVGFHEYGSQYADQILDAVRVQAEACDALGSFFSLSSVGGGTGSGLGSYISGLLAEHYPEVTNFCTSVFPSRQDDVITSPYNSIFSLSELQTHADCIMPLENQAMLDMTSKIDAVKQRQGGGAIIDTQTRASEIVGKGFDGVNNLVAHVLLNLTSSMRFPGSLNVDINEIATNLVPFPQLKYLLSTTTPVSLPRNVGHMNSARNVDQLFSDAFSKDSQLVLADVKRSLNLAVALIGRGGISLTDMRRNIDKLSSSIKFPSWNQGAWKVGLCAAPPLNQPCSLLTLSNSSCIRQTLQAMSKRFKLLYKRKANLHHYLEYMTKDEIEERFDKVSSTIKAYESIEQSEL